MGDALAGGSSSLMGEEKFSKNDLSHISYTEQFYSHLPFYLSIGMTYEQYWNEDCCLVKYFKQAHEMRQDRLNEELWLQGMYFYEALIDASPAFRSMGAKRPEKYVEEPYPRTEKNKKEQLEAKKKSAYADGFTKMQAFAANVNKKMQEKE